MRTPSKRPASRQQQRAALAATEVPEVAPRPATHATSLVPPLLAGHGTFTATGWKPPANMTQAEWLEDGKKIAAIERATPWFWADWWRHAPKQADPVDWPGAPKLHTLHNYISVANVFPESLRRESLTFTHHAMVVGLSRPQQDMLLDWAIANRASVTALRAALQRRFPPSPPPSQPSSPPSPRVTPQEEPSRPPSPPPSPRAAPLLIDYEEAAQAMPVPALVPDTDPAGQLDSLCEPVVPLPATPGMVEADSDAPAIPVTLWLPTGLHARVTTEAAATGEGLAEWLLHLIERETL